MCNHRSSYKNNLEKHIKNVHSSAKTSNNASSGIMQQQPQTGQPLVQPQQPQAFDIRVTATITTSSSNSASTTTFTGIMLFFLKNLYKTTKIQEQLCI